MLLPHPSPAARSSALVFLVLGVLLVTAPALAADAVLVKVTNTLGTAATGLKVTFSGSANDIDVSPASVGAAGCPLPTVSSNPPAASTTAVLDWGSPCVAPGATIAFIARTAAGPLLVSSAVWTGAGGVTLGAAAPTILHVPAPPAGSGPFQAIAYASIGIGGTRTNGPVGRTDQKIMMRSRRANRRWRTAIELGYFPDRLSRLLEKGPWVKLDAIGNAQPRTWRDEFWWPAGSFGLLGACASAPQPAPEDATVVPVRIGPPPTGLGDARFAAYDPADLDLDPRDSDDGGVTWRTSTDFTRSFAIVADSLATFAPDTLLSFPAQFVFSQFLTRMGARYVAAAGPLTPLLAEIDAVRAAEPNALLDNARTNVANIQSTMTAIGNQLIGGAATDGSPFFFLGSALDGLGSAIDNLDGSPRFNHAARELHDAATGARLASQLVQQGIHDSTTQSGFCYAIHTGLPGFLRAFSTAMGPHAVVDVTPCAWAWYPSATDGASVRLTDGFGAPLDTLPLRITDAGSVYVPLMNVSEGAALGVRLKLPNTLSVQWSIDRYTDGSHLGPVPLAGGDANNDDCINSQDQAQVTADLGKGGYFSTFQTPESDVNADGVVDNADQALVTQNVGRCGPGTAGVAGGAGSSIERLVAFPNPLGSHGGIQFELSHAAVVNMRLYDLRGRQMAVLVEGRAFAPGRHVVPLVAQRLDAGVYWCRMTAIGADGGMVERVARITLLR